MKAIKRTLAILMCFCMVFGCASITAFSEETVVGSITIQNPSHSDATVGGKTFNVYKVFDATTSGTNTSYSWYASPFMISSMAQTALLKQTRKTDTFRRLLTM